MITQDLVKELFNYQDGILIWKKRANVKSRARLGKEAGNYDGYGYKFVEINAKKYKVHRVIFLMFNGYLPFRVDHIDNNKDNNRIENLRAASIATNAQNSKLRCDNKSGAKGVMWDKERKKWRVEIKAFGKRVFQGRFDSLELAELVATEARDKFHKDFARDK